eukprot:13208314-Alexandrium_andersonii.AAC.1
MAGDPAGATLACCGWACGPGGLAALPPTPVLVQPAPLGRATGARAAERLQAHAHAVLRASRGDVVAPASPADCTPRCNSRRLGTHRGRTST